MVISLYLSGFYLKFLQRGFQYLNRTSRNAKPRPRPASFLSSTKAGPTGGVSTPQSWMLGRQMRGDRATTSGVPLASTNPIDKCFLGCGESAGKGRRVHNHKVRIKSLGCSIVSRHFIPSYVLTLRICFNVNKILALVYQLKQSNI